MSRIHMCVYTFLHLLMYFESTSPLFFPHNVFKIITLTPGFSSNGFHGRRKILLPLFFVDFCCLWHSLVCPANCSAAQTPFFWAAIFFPRLTSTVFKLWFDPPPSTYPPKAGSEEVKGLSTWNTIFVPHHVVPTTDPTLLGLYFRHKGAPWYWGLAYCRT
jgi:hypothetical protein